MATRHSSQWLPDSYTLLLLRSLIIPQEYPQSRPISSLTRGFWVNPIFRAYEYCTATTCIGLESALTFLIYFCNLDFLPYGEREAVNKTVLLHNQHGHKHLNPCGTCHSPWHLKIALQTRQIEMSWNLLILMNMSFELSSGVSQSLWLDLAFSHVQQKSKT